MLRLAPSLAVLLLVGLVGSVAQGQRHTERGALLGGLTGAMIGAAVGDNNGEGAEGALIGGAIGLFSGAALGNSADREEAYWQAARQHQHAVRRAEAVSVADVVQMSQNGLSDNVIMNQIRQRGVQRKVQVPEVIFLHQQGVSESVITAMQQTATAGVYTQRVVPARPAPMVIERHHYVAPHPYWHHPYYRPHYGAYRHPRYQPGVRFGISVSR